MSGLAATGGTFPGARVTPDDPRYATLVRGFNLRWVGRPSYVELCGDTDQVVRAVVTAAGAEAAGEILDQHVVKNPHPNGWRLTFQVRPKQSAPVELRAYLDQGNTVLSETWSYALHP